jgi:hypothetical protein
VPLKLSFSERPVYRAPLEVLQHLYYYTTQYGLSVAQFTGAHQKYWERLPTQLQKAQNSPEKMNSIIKELEVFAAGAKKRLLKRREQKDKGWAEKEIVLNAQLLSVLAAFPSELLANGFKELIHNDAIIPSKLRVVDLSIKKEDGNDAFVFVEPDILLKGENHLLMVELKTRGSSTSARKYPPSQLLNYFRLIAECQDSNDGGLPTSFSHLILVPSTELKWLEMHTGWVKDICDSQKRFRVDPDGCIKVGGGKSSYNHERVKELLDEVPIFYRSWEQLADAFRAAIQKFDDARNYQHWMKLGDELTDLAKIAGKYK